MLFHLPLNIAGIAHGWIWSANDVPQVIKLKFQIPQKDRYQQMLDYLRGDSFGARRLW